jgi:hypothetical protein
MVFVSWRGNFYARRHALLPEDLEDALLLRHSDRRDDGVQGESTTNWGTIGKPEENHRKTLGKWGKHRKTLGKP